MTRLHDAVDRVAEQEEGAEVRLERGPAGGDLERGLRARAVGAVERHEPDHREDGLPHRRHPEDEEDRDPPQPGWWKEARTNGDGGRGGFVGRRVGERESGSKATSRQTRGAQRHTRTTHTRCATHTQHTTRPPPHVASRNPRARTATRSDAQRAARASTGPHAGARARAREVRRRGDAPLSPSKPPKACESFSLPLQRECDSRCATFPSIVACTS